MDLREKVNKVIHKLSFAPIMGEKDLGFKNPKYEEADLKVCILQTGGWKTKMISATSNQLISLMRESNRFTGKTIYFDFAFRPDADECSILRENNLPDVFGWNSFRSLEEFDVVSISLSIHFEAIASLMLLKGAGIEPYFYDRLKCEKSPLIIAGGVVAQYVETCMGHPNGALYDLMLLGEGEDRLTDFTSALQKLKPRLKTDKLGVIKDLVKTFDNTYFPNGYQHIYDDSIPVEKEKEFLASLKENLKSNPIDIESRPPGVLIKDKSTKLSAILPLYPWVPEKVSYFRSYNTRPTMFEDKLFNIPNSRAGRGELQISHGALSGDTPVYTDHGIFELQDIVQRKLPYKAWTSRGYQKINNYVHVGPSPVYVVKTAAGREFKGTWDHRFQVVQDGVQEWKKFEDFKVGNWLVLRKGTRSAESILEYDKSVSKERQEWSEVLGSWFVGESDKFLLRSQDPEFESYEFNLNPFKATVQGGVSYQKSFVVGFLENPSTNFSERGISGLIKRLRVIQLFLLNLGIDSYVRPAEDSKGYLLVNPKDARKFEEEFRFYACIATLRYIKNVSWKGDFEKYCTPTDYPKEVDFIEEVESTKPPVKEEWIYDKIVSIEKGTANTYDIGVADCPEYAPYGIYGHNCSGRGACNFCSEGAEAGPWREYDIEGIKRNLDELVVNDASNSASYFSFNCVAEGTLVYTSKGAVPIEKLDTVLSKEDSIQGWFGPTKYKCVVKQPKKVLVKEIVLSSGHSLKLTPNHKQPIFDSQTGTRLVSGASLMVGDWVPTKLLEGFYKTDPIRAEKDLFYTLKPAELPSLYDIRFRTIEDWCQLGIRFSRIELIRETEEFVYDLVGSEDGYFVANGIVTHNSNYYSDTYGINYELAKRFSSISVLAFRADVVAETPDYLEFLKALGNIRITIALEGISDRVRNKILNKNLSWERFLKCCEYAFKARYALLKINLIMTGHEEDSDVQEFIEAMEKMDKLRSVFGAKTSIMFSCTTLVHYTNVGIQWLPRKSTIADRFRMRLLQKAIEAGRQWKMRFRFHCLGEGERVLTDRGFKKVENITEFEKVFAPNGYSSHKGVVRQGKSPVVNLVTDRGYSYVYTGNHIVSKDYFVETEVRRLRKGDRLLCSRGGLSGALEPLWDSYILGLLTHSWREETETGHRFEFRLDHTLKEIIKTHLDDSIEVEIIEQEESAASMEVFLTNEMLESLVGPEGIGIIKFCNENNSLPEDVWSYNPEELSSFVAGFYDGMKYVVGVPKLWDTILTKDFQTILLAFGVVTNREEGNVSSLSIADSLSRDFFLSNIPVKTPLIRDWIKEAFYGDLEPVYDRKGDVRKEYFYIQVVSVDSVEPREVYDITETRTGWFIHNGLVSHNSGREFTWQQLQVDAGRLASLPALSVCENAYEKNLNAFSIILDITNESFKFMGIDSDDKLKEYFLKERPKGGVSAGSAFGVIPEKLEKQWMKSVGNEPLTVCLRTVANPNAKCSACGFCTDMAYAKKHIWGRNYQTTKTLMDVEAALFQNKPLSAVRVSIAYRDGVFERYRRKIVHAHYVAAKILQACKPLADGFHKCSNYADYVACKMDQMDYWGGVSCFDMESRLYQSELESIIAEYRDVIKDSVNSEIESSVLLGLRVAPYPSNVKNQVSVWRFVCKDSKHSVTEMIQSNFNDKIKVWKSGDVSDFIEERHYPRQDLNIYMTQNKQNTVGHFTLSTWFNPLMAMNSMLGLSENQIRERFVLDRAALVDVVGSICKACGKATGIDSISGKPISLCPGCISKIMTAKAAN